MLYVGGGGGTESRVADVLLQGFAIHRALSTPARYRIAIYLRLFNFHVWCAGTILPPTQKSKTALTGGYF